MVLTLAMLFPTTSMKDMWFFMPEIAEKSARIMVVTILSVRRRGRAGGGGSGLRHADQPSGFAICGRRLPIRLGDDDGVNVGEDAVLSLLSVEGGDDGPLADIDDDGEAIEHDDAVA